MVKEVLVVMKSLAQAGYTILVVTHEVSFASVCGEPNPVCGRR